MAFSPVETLDSLHACCWSTASLPRSQVAAIAAEAASHADSALVTSCQRLEAYSLAACTTFPAPERAAGFEALVHLAEVAAGLHSVVLGEREILGQVRSALAVAPARLRGLGDIAVGAARDLRRETHFDSHAGHLLDRGLRLAGVPASGRILVLGTGRMGRLVCERAAVLGFSEIVLAGRTRPRGMDEQWSFVPLDEIGRLAPVDLAVGCLGSGAPELRVAELPRVRRLLLDFGTPRNFAGVPSTPSLMIADLLAFEECERPHAVRKRSALRQRLRSIVEERLSRFTGTGTATTALRLEVERIRQRELDRARRLHPEIPDGTLDALSRSLVNQILHRPTERLRASGDATLARELAHLFIA
jgi:glutamyl-tRNA reductase